MCRCCESHDNNAVSCWTCASSEHTTRHNRTISQLSLSFNSLPASTVTITDAYSLLIISTDEHRFHWQTHLCFVWPYDRWVEVFICWRKCLFAAPDAVTSHWVNHWHIIAAQSLCGGVSTPACVPLESVPGCPRLVIISVFNWQFKLVLVLIFLDNFSFR